MSLSPAGSAVVGLLTALAAVGFLSLPPEVTQQDRRHGERAERDERDHGDAAPAGPEREGGAAGGGAAGGGSVGGADAGGATGCADACVGWATGGIEAPEGGADAGGGRRGRRPRLWRGRHRRGRWRRRGLRGRRGGRCAAEADRREDAPVLRLLLHRDRVTCRRRQLARGRIAIRGILGRRLGDDVVEGGHEIAARRAGPRRRVADVRPELGDVAVLRVGDLAGQHLVEDAAQRVDVRAPVDRVALDLLGGDVVGRPHPEARSRQPSRRPGTLGQPEVGQVRRASARSRRRSGCSPA